MTDEIQRFMILTCCTRDLATTEGGRGKRSYWGAVREFQCVVHDIPESVRLTWSAHVSFIWLSGWAVWRHVLAGFMVMGLVNNGKPSRKVGIPLSCHGRSSMGVRRRKFSVPWYARHQLAIFWYGGKLLCSSGRIAGSTQCWRRRRMRRDILGITRHWRGCLLPGMRIFQGIGSCARQWGTGFEKILTEAGPVYGWMAGCWIIWYQAGPLWTGIGQHLQR